MKKVLWPTLSVVWMFLCTILCAEAMSVPDTFSKIIVGSITFWGVEIHIIKKALNVFNEDNRG